MYNRIRWWRFRGQLGIGPIPPRRQTTPTIPLDCFIPVRCRSTSTVGIILPLPTGLRYIGIPLGHRRGPGFRRCLWWIRKSWHVHIWIPISCCRIHCGYTFWHGRIHGRRSWKIRWPVRHIHMCPTVVHSRPIRHPMLGNPQLILSMA